MIKSLQSLRFYLAMTIFFTHLDFVSNTTLGKYIYTYYLGNGNFGVTFFFILSGFTITLGYGDKFDKVNKKSWIEFVKKRIAKIYLLYIITIASVYFTNIIIHHSLRYTITETLKFLLCVSLLQALTLKYWGLFNTVAWFLSCIFVLYLITPFITKLLYPIRNKNGYLILLLLGTYSMLSVILFNIGYFVPEKKAFIIVYCTPYVRVFYYLIGMLMSNIYKNIKDNILLKKSIFNILEILITTLAILIYFIGIRTQNNYQTETLLYIPIFLSFILIFSFDKGIISRFLKKSLNIYLGSMSFDFFLIHYLIVIYGSKLLLNIFGISDFKVLVYSLILFFITLLFSMISHKYLKLRNVVSS